MRTFHGTRRSTLPTVQVIKALLGIHVMGWCIYNFKIKPSVQKKNNFTEEDWTNLTSAQRYCYVLGKHPSDYQVKKYKAKIVLGTSDDSQLHAAESKNIIPASRNDSHSEKPDITAENEYTPR